MLPGRKLRRLALWSIATLLFGCEEPGTPNQERATAVSPNSIRLDWNNTASEGNIFFDIEGQSDPSIANFGPFNAGRNKPVSYTVGGLATNRQHCYRMWARVGNNGCRSKVPSAWACAMPTPSTKPPVPPPNNNLTIGLSEPATNNFTITGAHFLGGRVVHIRVVDDALTTRWFSTTANGSGGFALLLRGLCVRPGNLHFSANDGRPNTADVTGTLWSNTVTGTCR
jgi:hypothetical protein